MNESGTWKTNISSVPSATISCVPTKCWVLCQKLTSVAVNLTAPETLGTVTAPFTGEADGLPEAVWQ